VPITDRNGFLGAQTASAVRAFKSTHGPPDNARVTGAVWSALSV